MTEDPGRPAGSAPRGDGSGRTADRGGALEAGELAADMIAAVRQSLDRDWRSARHFAEPELRRLGQSLADIGTLASTGRITQEEARSLLRIHRNTTESVLLTVEGLGRLATENAVNAALGVVRDRVNALVGVPLL